MPQQSARAPVGDQGGGGAVLTPIRRLTLAGVVTVQVRGDVTSRSVAYVRAEANDPTLEVRRVATGSGIGVTAAGAAVSILAAIAGGISGRLVPRMRMPESPGPEPPA